MKESLRNAAVESLVLTNLLIDRFEFMLENNLVRHKLKSITKQANSEFSKYINDVFSCKDERESEALRPGADIILFKQNQIDALLKRTDIVIIDDRNKILEDILIEHNINSTDLKLILQKVNDSEILKF